MQKIEVKNNSATNNCFSYYLNLCTASKTIKNIGSVVKNNITCGIKVYMGDYKKDSEFLILEHYKEQDTYYSQWIQFTQGKEKKIGQVYTSKKSLNFYNPRLKNQLKEQVKNFIGIGKIEEFLDETADLISNNFDTFFPKKYEFKLAGETAREKHLRKIAKELEEKYWIIRDKETKELYIYNENKERYKLFNDGDFTQFIQQEYDYKFFESDAKKIMSTFTNFQEENTNYISFENGLLNLKTLKLEIKTPSIYCKFIIPYNYNPNAYSSFFEEKLQDIMFDTKSSDEKFQLYLQMIGYCMFPDNRHNKMFLFTGSGGNGKSTLMSLIRAIFQEYVVNVSLQDFSTQFGLQPLIGAKVNILYDLPLKPIEDAGIIKAITGEDSITIHRKFKDPVTTKIGAKIIGTGNSLPPVNDKSKAFYRRIIHVELINTFTNPDSDLSERMVKDRDGMEWLIYNAIQKFKKVKKDGWAIQPTISQSNDDYLKHSKPCLWVAKKLFKRGNQSDFIVRSDAYEEMSSYLENEKIVAPVARAPYYRALEEIGGDFGYTNSDRVYRGLKRK